MRKMLLNGRIYFEKDKNEDGETFYILRLEYGKNYIISLVRESLEDLLKDVPGFLIQSIDIDSKKVEQKMGVIN